MSVHHTARRVRLGTVNRDELAALVAVLAPYRDQVITPTVLALAARVARLEAREATAKAGEVPA